HGTQAKAHPRRTGATPARGVVTADEPTRVGRRGMRPSDTQLAIEKGVRLEPLREAVLAEGADLRSDEIVALVKKAVAYRPTTVDDICLYTGLSEEEVRRLWGEILDQRPA